MVPYEKVHTLFLDVGNTLLSIDFDWVAAEINARGSPSDPSSLRRAEAAARPEVSRRLSVDTLHGPDDPFHMYLSTILSKAPALISQGSGLIDSLVTDLVPVLGITGQANRLWRSVIPGVPEALDTFRSLGLRLVVVSNSDGTVERSLIAAGLRHHFAEVVDSSIVGFEKPDPRIFDYALAEAASRPSEVLHVGDLFHTDVEGARGAGIHAVLLDPYNDWVGVECERVVDLAELAIGFSQNRGVAP